MFSFFVVLVEVLASIIVLFCTSLFGLEAMQFCDVCKPLSLGEAGERPPFVFVTKVRCTLTFAFRR